MAKVINGLQLWQSLGLDPGANEKLWSVLGVSLLVIFYVGFSSLWGVVSADLFQFALALLGAVIVAIAATNCDRPACDRS